MTDGVFLFMAHLGKRLVKAVRHEDGIISETIGTPL